MKFWKIFLNAFKVVLFLTAFFVIGNVGGIFPVLITTVFRPDTPLALPNERSAVLGSATQKFDVLKALGFNIPTSFNNTVTLNKDVTVNGRTTFNNDITIPNHNLDLGTGQLTASNVLYGVTAGTGLTSTGGQTPILALALKNGDGININGPTITNTGVLSLQGTTGALSLTAGSGIGISGLTITNNQPGGNAFGNIAVGSSSFTAGNTSDKLTFTAGSGISLSADTSNKKITISQGSGASGSFSSITDTGLTSGSIPYINSSQAFAQDNNNLFWDATNARLGIGTNAPAAGLHVAETTSVFGTGEGGTPTATTVRGPAGSGTNIIGANFTLDASNGTGAGGSGDLIFRTAAATGAVTFDNSANFSNTASSATNSFSFTTTTNNNRLLLVTAGSTNNGADSVSSMTYGGQSLTQLNSVTATNGGNNVLEIWYLVNPPSGSNTLSVTWKDSATRVITISSFYNVNQSQPFGSASSPYGSVTSTANSGSTSVSVTSNTSQLIFDALEQSAPYQAAVATESSIVDFWPLNEVSGTTARDIIGTNNGTISSSGVTLNQTGLLSDGSSTPCMKFNGSTGQISLPNGIQIAHPLTLEFWVRPDTQSSNESMVTTGAYGAEINQGAGQFHWYENGGSYDNTSVTYGTTYYIVETAASDNTLYNYVGYSGSVRTGSSGNPGGSTLNYSSNNGGNNYIGAGPHTNFTGCIQDVALYNTLLTNAQMTNHFLTGTTTPSWTAGSGQTQESGSATSYVESLYNSYKSGASSSTTMSWSGTYDIHNQIAVAIQSATNSNADTFTDRFHITSGGNLGVGVSNPSSFPLQIAGNVGPNATDTYNLGASGTEWNNLYVKNVITTATSGSNGYWQVNSGALSPASITNDLLIGNIATSSALFQVFANSGNATSSGSLTFTSAGNIQTTSNQTFVIGGNTTGDIQFKPGNSGSSLYLASSGRVGVNNTAPLATVDLKTISGTIPVASISGKTSFAGLVVDNSGVGDLFTASSSGLNRFVVTQNGNVGIGTSNPAHTLSVNASCTNFQTTGNCGDYAEFYNASEVVSPADIVSLDTTSSSEKLVQRSRSAYDFNVIGVAATNPAFVIEEGQIGVGGGLVSPSAKPPVALAGRVPVKVSTLNGAMHRGDAVTSSIMTGLGMKLTHAGPTVGKVMEDFDPEKGSVGEGIIPCPDGTPSEIICGKTYVFINVSWSDPGIIMTLNGNLANTDATSNGILAGAQVNQLPAFSHMPSDQINTVSTALSQVQASSSAMFTKLNDLSNIVSVLEKEIPTLSASSSGIDSGNATISGKLSVIGKTTLNTVGITGKVTMGLLTIDGMGDDATPAASINTLSGTLKLQSFALGGIDILGGKVTIDTNGNLVVNGEITAKSVKVDELKISRLKDQASTIGIATISAGLTHVEVKTKAITDKSQIYTSLKTLIDEPLVITHQDVAKSFTVEIVKPFGKDIEFSWWLIN